MIAQEDAKALLRDGIDIAKSGDKRLAHTLLAQATRLDPHNERAWLWLAGVAHDSAEAADCLQHVLNLNPQSQAAMKGLACLGISNNENPSAKSASSGSNKFPPGYYEAVTVPSRSNVAHSTRSPAAPTSPTHGQMQFSGNQGQLDPAIDLSEPTADSQAVRAPSVVDKADRIQSKPRADLPGKPVKVLVVDDSPTIRKLVAMTLGKHGFEVVAAADGMEALARINDGAPNLILLDITMPRMDGYQLCRTIKGNSSTDHIPIVMLTGKDGFMDKVRGRMVGSEGYLTKPFQPDELVRMVEQHVN